MIEQFLLAGNAYLLAHYNKKDDDKFGFYLWMFNGVMWSIAFIVTFITNLFQ